MTVEAIVVVESVAAALRGAGEIVKGLRKEKKIDDADAVVLLDSLMTAQGVALSLQAANAALLEQVSSLKAELAGVETWDMEKAKYTLQPLGRGVFAYKRNPGAEPDQGEHYICPNCYEDRRKSILQRLSRGQTGPGVHLLCNQCTATFQM